MSNFGLRFGIDRTSSINALVSLLSRTYPTPVPSNGELMHLIDIPHASRLIKTLVQGGHFDKKTSAISLAPSWSTSTTDQPPPRVAFIKAFVSEIDEEDMLKMACASGAFVIAELISATTKELGEQLKEEREVLKGYFGAEAVKKITSARPKGMDVLLERVKAL